MAFHGWPVGFFFALHSKVACKDVKCFSKGVDVEEIYAKSINFQFLTQRR